MVRTVRRLIPAAALAMAALVGGCVIVPESGYRPYHGHGHYGWGWRR